MKEKVVVITGASGGIGAALARHLAEKGHHLVLAARRMKELNAVAEECRGLAIAVPTDVTERSQVENLRNKALEAFDHVDVWVNNAGRGISRSVADLSDEDFDHMMSVNVKSALYGMQSILPHFMQRGQGHLINVSSFLGRVPLVPQRSAYNAAKAALNALTANLRVDLKKSHPGIHVSLVMPGVVRTEFAKNALGSQGSGGHGAAPSQSAEEVAEVITGLLEIPQAEVYTNPSSREIAQSYYRDVAAFEGSMGR